MLVSTNLIRASSSLSCCAAKTMKVNGETVYPKRSLTYRRQTFKSVSDAVRVTRNF
jgi:hypothetical protein